MSSAIVLVGNQHVIPLVGRLVVGIRLQGTVGFVDPANPYVVKSRPYAAYLATTLRRLQCAVALFVPTNTEHDREMMNTFYRRDFTVPFLYVHDHPKIIGSGSGRGNRKRGLAPNNYTEYLRIMANEVNGAGQDTSRILFIDSEVNYRFTPVQTIVLDAYEPVTRRQAREMVKRQQSHTFGDVSSRYARRYAAATARATKTTVGYRAAVSAQALEDEIGVQRKHTELLVAEQDKVPLSAEVQDEGDGYHGGDLRDLPREQPQQTPLSPPSSMSRPPQGRSPQGCVEDQPSVRVSSSTADYENVSASPDGSHDAKEEKQPHQHSMARALAINLEDYTLVALAEMIAEMAACEISVAEYIKTEPLIEKVEVPFHGKANYLAPENCDHIDLLNWDEIRVTEKIRDAEVPETVEETEDHKNLFR